MGKWRIERSRRSFSVFAMDSSKQVIGAGWIHTMNMICAIALSRFVPIKSSEGATTDECGWYWVNIMVDTTIGVCVSYGILKFFEQRLRFRSGCYDPSWNEAEPAQEYILFEREQKENPLSARDTLYHSYWKQLAVWIGVVTLMKCCMVILMVSFSSSWGMLANLCTGWIRNTDVRLFFCYDCNAFCHERFSIRCDR